MWRALRRDDWRGGDATNMAAISAATAASAVCATAGAAARRPDGAPGGERREERGFEDADRLRGKRTSGSVSSNGAAKRQQRHATE